MPLHEQRDKPRNGVLHWFGFANPGRDVSSDSSREGLFSAAQDRDGDDDPEPDLAAESTPTGGWCQMKQASIFTENLPKSNVHKC